MLWANLQNKPSVGGVTRKGALIDKSTGEFYGEVNCRGHLGVLKKELVFFLEMHGIYNEWTGGECVKSIVWGPSWLTNCQLRCG